MNHSLLCIPVCGPTLNDAYRQLLTACLYADVIELRLDCFHYMGLEAIRSLKNASTRPVIFTLRKKSQGGSYIKSESKRFARILQLASLKPAYIDLEYDVDPSFYETLCSTFPKCEIISSFHDFYSAHSTKDLKTILEKMQRLPASIYKIATMAKTTVDALNMLCFIKENVRQEIRLAGISMGEHGQLTRILGPIFGSALIYAALLEELKMAPGQLNVDELIERYHYKSLNPKTAILGLIGDPVTKSPSYLTHNAVIKQIGLDAIYLKLKVSQAELNECLHLTNQLNFMGLSITMPLKEAVLKEVVTPSKEVAAIGAANTLKFSKSNLHVFNTDGKGALNALEATTAVNGKTLVILGAGGAAKAIGWEAKARGAKLVILNRTLEKAQALATRLDAEFGLLAEFPTFASKGYDILINSTSLGMSVDQLQLPIDCNQLLIGKIVMDIIPGCEPTPFLIEAKRRGCTTISGNEMLMLQAIEQFLIWFGDSLPKEKLKAAFQEAFGREELSPATLTLIHI